MTAVSPPDDAAHKDGVLMADVIRINTLLGRYVLRFQGHGQFCDEPRWRSTYD